MKWIVGWGNPGKEYENTRHNAGFMMIDYYASQNGITKFKEFKNGLYAEINSTEKVILLKPLSYMNLSGEVIRSYVNYFKINLDDILVIHDDMDIKIGNVKLKFEGSAAGHNGIKNIIENLHTDKFKRIKVGISKNNIEQVAYVIGKFSKEEMQKLDDVKIMVNNIIDDYLKMDFEKVMSKYNKKNIWGYYVWKFICKK